MRENLISINNSGESLEKSISILYTNMIENSDFYSKYNTIIFYGYNLPKTNASLFASGTIGFYDKYMSDCEFPEAICIKDIWNNKENVLNDLVKRNVLSSRTAEKLFNNYNLFYPIISKLPVQVVYPTFHLNLINYLKIIFPNVTFCFMNLFDSFEKIFYSLSEFENIYKIYGLQANGEVGVFNFNIVNNEYYNRNLAHLFKSLSKSIILSGNSAVFLAQIQKEIEKIEKKSSCIIGYRNHKHTRFSREVALKNILDNYTNTIIEPKNKLYNTYFDKFTKIENSEEKTNVVVASAYHDFIKENIKVLKLKK